MKKIVIVLLAIIVCGGIVFMFWPNNHPNAETNGSTTDNQNIKIITGLKTCEICGYDAVKAPGQACKVCGFIINDSSLNAEGLDKKSFLAMKQIEYFMPDSLGMSIDFLNPKISYKGYPKSATWRPSVYESEIYDFQKIMFDVETILADSNKSTL
ncbi:MAG: hypothetical protein ACPGLV_10085 [Bacteroidia bacterium]